MGVWGTRIDTMAFPIITPERVSALFEALQLLSFRVEVALDARSASRDGGLVAELRQSTRAWQSIAEESFRQWSATPEVDSSRDLRAELSDRLAKLDARIQELLDRAGPEEISESEGREFYRLLGGYRGATQAALDYADQSRRIDWAQWREERFA